MVQSLRCVQRLTPVQGSMFKGFKDRVGGELARFDNSQNVKISGTMPKDIGKRLPHADASGTWPNSVKMIRENAKISDADKERILVGNARRFFRL